jgi:ligand-binding sensor domain-containing protein/signal transduction histidine kinase
MRPLLVLLLLLDLTPSDVRAERVEIKSYSTQEGLGHFAVNRIVRDSHGYLWIGTREGLSRFDGYGFTTLRTADGLPSGNVSDILETPEGIYWIGTLEGLVRFDPAAPPATRFTVLPRPGDTRTSAITCLARDASGTIWVGTSGGLFRIDPGPGTPRMVEVSLAIQDELNALVIQALLVDRRGTVWAAAGPGFYVRSPDGRIARLTGAEGLPHVTVLAMMEDSSGRIWAGTTAGLWRIDEEEPGRLRLRGRYSPAEGAPDPRVGALLEASDGSLWAGTLSGLTRLEVAGDSLVRFTPVRASTGRTIPSVSALVEDAGGHLWVGTNDSGVFRLPLSGFRIVGADEGLTSATAIADGADGNVAVFATSPTDWSIFCSDGRTTRRVKPGGDLGLHSWAWNQILMRGSSGDWWIGLGGGAFRFIGARTCTDLDGRQPATRLDTRSGLVTDTVIRLFEDSRGDLWIGTVGHGVRPDGLSRWDRRTGRLQNFAERDGLPTFARHYVSALAEDRAGNVWVGFSRDAGLARYRNGRFDLFTTVHGVPAGQIRNIAFDGDGRMWIASYRAGVLRVDDPTAARPSFRIYSTADGLSANEVHAIVVDTTGKVFIASARGVDRLDPVTGLVRHYSQADGVPAAEFKAAHRDRNGTLWFTHSHGVSVFAPTAERAGRPPRVLITAVSVDGEPHPVSAVGETTVAPFWLPHQRNSLQVSFVATGTRAGGDHLYRYMLENGGDAWSRFSETRSVNFASLAPGAYRLLVEARNADGDVSASPAVLTFTIVPPVWQRRWFIGLVLAGAIAAGYVLHRSRLSRLVEITRIRDRIAADLHDDLGANLTKIAVLGEVARRQTAPSDAALSSMTSIARESVANMSDIVWAVDPARDSLEDLLRKMREHASETFALGQAELVFTAPRRVDARQIGIELRHDLFLLFKEAVNNAARHAQAKRVDIELAVERGTVRLRISDDGIGMEPGRPGDGRGLGSMRKRAARMAGKIEIASAPGRGTSILVTVPLRG